MLCMFYYFFFNDTATTEIYTLSLHDALPIFKNLEHGRPDDPELLTAIGDLERVQMDVSVAGEKLWDAALYVHLDRKSTRLNSQSRQYLVCRLLLEKKKNTTIYPSRI